MASRTRPCPTRMKGRASRRPRLRAAAPHLAASLAETAFETRLESTGWHWGKVGRTPSHSRRLADFRPGTQMQMYAVEADADAPARLDLVVREMRPGRLWLWLCTKIVAAHQHLHLAEHCERARATRCARKVWCRWCWWCQWWQWWRVESRESRVRESIRQDRAPELLTQPIQRHLPSPQPSTLLQRCTWHVIVSARHHH